MTTIADQPPPIPSDRPAIADLVIADMAERKRLGIERYGTPLQAHNGRDALIDAYQEALDLCCYLRQAIEEDARRVEDAAWHQLWLMRDWDDIIAPLTVEQQGVAFAAVERELRRIPGDVYRCPECGATDVD
jgi:hypothetical protein